MINETAHLMKEREAERIQAAIDKANAAYQPPPEDRFRTRKDAPVPGLPSPAASPPNSPHQLTPLHRPPSALSRLISRPSHHSLDQLNAIHSPPSAPVRCSEPDASFTTDYEKHKTPPDGLLDPSLNAFKTIPSPISFRLSPSTIITQANNPLYPHNHLGYKLIHHFPMSGRVPLAQIS